MALDTDLALHRIFGKESFRSVQREVIEVSPARIASHPSLTNCRQLWPVMMSISKLRRVWSSVLRGSTTQIDDFALKRSREEPYLPTSRGGDGPRVDGRNFAVALHHGKTRIPPTMRVFT